MKQLTKVRLLAFSVVTIVMCCAGAALAQSDPTPAANNPNPAALVSWCFLGYLAISSVVKALQPDNPMLPFSVPTSVRVMIATIGTAVLGSLTAIIGGVPWTQALLSAGLALFAILTKHTLPFSKGSPAPAR